MGAGSKMIASAEEALGLAFWVGAILLGLLLSWWLVDVVVRALFRKIDQKSYDDPS